MTECAQRPEVTEADNVEIVLRHAGHSVKIAAKTRITGSSLLILLHGLGCGKESFEGAFATSILDDYSLCSFDFPGHGQSSGLPPELNTIGCYASITQKVASRLMDDAPELERVLIAGHSMGGAVGIVSLQDADDITGMISIDGNLIGDDCGLVSRRIAESSDREFEETGFRDFIAGLRGSRQPAFRVWGDWAAEAEPLALRRASDSLVSWSDSGTLLRHFNAMPKKAYLYGANDDKEYLIRQFNGVDVIRVPDSGHFMMLDNPGEFYELLANSLKIL